MKLHRLVLVNYRGISHREIEFPDCGVVVVSGANEVGKSSMIEALDLLLEAKDRSTKKEVKQVKPTHADVGAEITAEISSGPYRFIYRKRFHKRCETQLTVLAPQREQLTGDEAHERVCAMLDESVDMDLWRAQRVLQAASTNGVDLSGSDALSRALDIAAGRAPTGAVDPESTDGLATGRIGDDTLLIDRIEEEFLRYFTPTGRPTGEWAGAVKRLRDADERVGSCAAAVAEVDDAVRKHVALTADVNRLAADRGAATERLAVAHLAANEVAQLTQQLKEAEVVAAAAATTLTASVAALNERRRLRADIDQRAKAITQLDSEARRAAEDESTARGTQAEAESAAEHARTVVESAQQSLEAAQLTAQRLADRGEAAQISERLARIDTAAGELLIVEEQLASIALTDESLREIEAAAVAVARAAGQVELASAHIEMVALADVELRVAGEPVSLQAGASWSAAATTPTDVELPGQLVTRIVPGAPAADTQAELDTAQHVLRSALKDSAVEDVDDAREVDRRRRELLTTRSRLQATLEALTGDSTVEALRARTAELLGPEPGWEPAAVGPCDAATARAEAEAALAAHRQASADCESYRRAAASATQMLGEKCTAASVLREKLAAAQTELAGARERLATQRGAADDDTLAVKAEADGEAARRADARVIDLRGEREKSAPDDVAAELAEAGRCAEALQGSHAEAVEALREVTAQLRVYGTEGRKGLLDDAESEREHAAAEHVRVQRRARAAQLLRSVMARHRDATRRRYVDPFRAEVERLGRIVFGESFEVDIDSDLRVRNRTLSGRTVDYESLSGGAKEQLGIIARLAGAVLVAKEDSVPVIIDDALGFTDAERLTKMGAVFDAVGDAGQVIVLTCTPTRYADIGVAQRIELTA